MINTGTSNMFPCGEAEQSWEHCSPYSMTSAVQSLRRKVPGVDGALREFITPRHSKKGNLHN